MLPQTSEGWRNLVLRQAEELSSKDERFTAMEAKHTEAYREAIAQRDEAREDAIKWRDHYDAASVRLSQASERAEKSETAHDRAAEIIRKYDTAIGQAFTTFPDQPKTIMDHLATIDAWLGLYKDRAEKLEAALAIVRAQGREEGLREADEKINTPETEDQERSFTERGFENFGELRDVHGNTVTVRQSSARLDTVHLFCKAARPMDMEAYKNEATRKYMLSITSPILDASQARDLAAALTRFADTAEDVLGFCKFSLHPHRKVASCVDWRPND